MAEQAKLLRTEQSSLGDVKNMYVLSLISINVLLSLNRLNMNRAVSLKRLRLFFFFC